MPEKRRSDLAAAIRHCAGPALFAIALAIAVVALVAIAGARADRGADTPAQGRAAVPSWNPAFDASLERDFAAPHRRAETPYDDIFAYFVTSFIDRERPGGSRADQPGVPSRHGRDTDAFESFARLAPMVGAWLASGRSPVITDLRGRSVDLRRLLHDGIVNGTTPGTPAYWGRMKPLDQRIVEAADVARTIWIVRQRNIFTPAEIAGAAAWLHQAEGLRVPDNNWHLYPVLIGEVLKSLGQPYDQADIDANWRRFISFYRGDGWFSDGPVSEFDFYNAWGIHYELFWLRRISPDFGGARIADEMSKFVATYPYLMSTDGLPIMGRSVCYRMAAPSPLVAAALAPVSADDPHVDPGLARRALDAIWSYFVSKGAVADGVPTQGYCGVDLRVVDNYSGPASCLWAARSLVLAFTAPPDAPFWTAPLEPLPIERHDYRVAIPAIKWTIVGNSSSRDVRIFRATTHFLSHPPPLESYGILRQAASAVLWRPFRPKNWAAKYDAPVYSSAHPFCGCTTPLAEQLSASLGE